MTLVVADLVRDAKAALIRAGVDDAAREARSLVALALNVPADRISLMSRDEVPPEARSHLDALILRRAQNRVPLSHLMGRRAFFHHEFEVSADVLDPRPDTETLVEAALETPFQSVLDLGTGSGCILLSLLAARPDASGIGTDVSGPALEVAVRNATRLGLLDRCLFQQANWFEGVDGRFDLIVSNPPYIAAAEMSSLAPELLHEPRGALTDEDDGLSAYRVIVPGAVHHLNPGGRVMVEIGWQQGAAVAQMFQTTGFEEVRVLEDLNGKDRVVCGVR